MCRSLQKGGDPVFSRYLRLAAAIAFLFAASAASACPGAKMKSADGSHGSAPSTTQKGG
jgi:hypothetical protein